MMKLLNKRQKNNGGFSLVELIVVIAIMVVLVAVLAPLFSKYIESSRRSTDVQNANSIAESVVADAANNAGWYQSYTDNAVTEVVASKPTTIKDVPAVKGDAAAATPSQGKFYFSYDKSSNRCKVTIATSQPDSIAANADLSDEKIANNYKNTKTAGTFPSGDTE